MSENTDYDKACREIARIAADAELSAVINNDETNIIISLLKQLESVQKERDELRAEQKEHDGQIAEMEGKIRIRNTGLRLKTELYEKAKAALSAANEKLLVPGVLHCAKCSFQLAKTNLYLKSGTTGPGDNKTEPCPNGCGPLWPVTWEQWSREIGVQLDRYFDEAKELKVKLANPVVLNTSDIMSRKHVTEAIKAAGFTVEGGVSYGEANNGRN